MKAAFLTELRRIEIRDVPPPELREADDVLLRIRSVGVCGSDVHYYKTGRIGSQVVQFPWVMGHECAAEVVAVGPAAAKDFRPGVRVVVDPLIWCGECDQCLAGRFHTCRRQRFLGCPGQAPGAMAEAIVMPGGCCRPMPEALTLEEGVMAEPLSIAMYAVRLSRPGPRRKIAILGCGPIGLCTLLALRAAGESAICMTDVIEERLAFARRCGAAWTGNPRRADVVAELRRVEPPGFDCVFECAGEQETLDHASELLKPGGQMVLVGIPEVDRVTFNMDLLRRKELCLQNVRRQNECLAAALDLLAAGRAEVKPLVTHRFPLAETDKAFELVAARADGVVKAVIEVAP
jgi:L-iditol 2-dehydrogenase